MLPSEDARALTTYEDALQRDPKLLEDSEIEAEILEVIRRPHARAAALELVLHQFGERQGPVLLELVDDDTHPLGYRDRQRALAAIANDSEAASKVDRELQTMLDLWQSSAADSPCLAFAAALATMERAPSARYLGSLHRVHPPAAPQHADANTLALCNALPTRLDAVKREIAAVFPVPSTMWATPPAFASAAEDEVAGAGKGAVAPGS
jgi:hypothetical protein